MAFLPTYTQPKLITQKHYPPGDEEVPITGSRKKQNIDKYQ